jgi:hypothetical protein
MESVQQQQIPDSRGKPNVVRISSVRAPSAVLSITDVDAARRSRRLLGEVLTGSRRKMRLVRSASHVSDRTHSDRRTQPRGAASARLAHVGLKGCQVILSE